MQTVQEGSWQPPHKSNHASAPRPRPPSSSRLAYVETATPAKRITFYRSGDSQFGGVRMAIHKRSFKCFDALLDDLSQKMPLPFGVRTVTTPRGTHVIKHLEELQDGGCYLCSDRRQPKPINVEHANKARSIWHHHGRKTAQPETLLTSSSGLLPHRHRRILLIKNTEPGMRRSVVLNRSSIRSLRAFLEEVSEVMQFHVRKIYTAEGRRVDNVQSLMTCPGVLVCVGREALSPLLMKILRKSSEEKLPGLSNKSPGFGPRTPGNGARSPGIREARSPPHGAHSRASECSEGQESRKNVNFGLETKKSIIHPRSDSSTRSTRLSLSSEKSIGNGIRAHSQQRPAMMNDDIEKRVLVNKDGSLSVEMRVRFRLRNDETVQWSTEIGKSHSLTSDYCPPSHAHNPYLQNCQSQSCSDCATVDTDSMDYSSHALQVSQCHCCYQMREQQYNLWENPIHSQKQPPVPPPYMSSQTHTTVRHTHSSGSSSSCNSMRVVRCQAKLSNCGRGSDSEHSHLVQEETCVVEQVERRLDMGEIEDTNFEVCMMSRCSSRSEVVTLNGNARSPRERSVVDKPMEEEVDQPLSRVSSSSHVLQSLKEDQDVDDDLPPSASRCSHGTGPSPKAPLNNNQPINLSNEVNQPDDQKNQTNGTASAATSCICVSEMKDQTLRFSSNVSRASCISTKVVNQAHKSEEVISVVRASSGISGLSPMSSVCPHCGGYKWAVTSNRSSRASGRSCHTAQAHSNPHSPIQNQESTNDCMNDDALSTQSNKSNLTGQRSAIADVLKSETSSAISRMSSPEPTEKEQERVSSTLSHKSNTPQQSVCTNATSENNIKRSSSAMSGQSNKSNLNAAVQGSTVTTTERAKGGTLYKQDAKSCVSPNTVLRVRKKFPSDNATLEDSRSHSHPSVNSNVSINSGTEDRSNSVLSTTSSKSNISGKSKISCHKSTNSQWAKDETVAVEPNETEEETDTRLENPDVKGKKQDCHTEEESVSNALSANSTTSCCTTRVSNCTGDCPNLEEANVSLIEVNGSRSNEDKERGASPISIKSKSSSSPSPSQKSVSTKTLKSSSQKTNVVTIETPQGVDEIRDVIEPARKTVDGEEVEERNSQSKTSEHSYGQMLSPKRIRSSRSHLQKVRAASPGSSNDKASCKSGSFKCQCVVASAFEELNEVEDSRGTEQLSQHSSGSVSLGLPDDQEMCDTDSCKSCISFHAANHNKDGVRAATHLGFQSISSQNSKVNESPRAVDVPTIDAPEPDGDVDNHPKENICASPASSSNTKRITDKRTPSSLSSVRANVKNSKPAQQPDADVTTVDSDKSSSQKSASRAKEKDKSLINKAANAHSSGLCSLACDLAADANVNGLKQSKGEGTVEASDSGSVQSVKTSSSTKKGISVRSSRHSNSRACTKETRGESTVSAAGLLKGTKAAHQHCQQSSKASKASSKQHLEKNKRHQKDQGEGVEVTPACLPNASPSEVVSDWLRSIPSNSNMIALEELIEDVHGKEVMLQAEEEVTESEEEHHEEDKSDKVEKDAGGDQKEEEGCAAVNEDENTDLATGVGAVKASHQPNSAWISGKALPKDWRSSAAVMKVLLSSSLGRCRSLPEVSPVHGRRLSTSARGLLDCLAQLQLIEPVRGQRCNKREDRNLQYSDIIAILQSLWLTEPRDIDPKDTGIEQATPPRSSSGVGMSSGSGGSGKDQDNQVGDETLPKESSHDDGAEERVSEGRIEPHSLEVKAEVQQPWQSENQPEVPAILESLKDANPSSFDKSSANNSSNSSTTTPPTVLQTSLSNKTSQDPDPVWVLHLLQKLEKEFMNHYIDAMAEFKVRWDLDDSRILDTMIAELRDEVSQRIQSSIKREMSKIHSRSGRRGKSPRPPKGANLSRDSTMTEKRRRMLKVMKNQSVKTAESFSDSEMTAAFSDQRSDDEYCPCDACVRKKMAARPLKMNPAAAEAPVMMEFDLLKILQLRKTPAPVPTSAPQLSDRGDGSVVVEEEVRSLEVVQEEEEDNESSDEFKTEETVPDEDEEDPVEEVKHEGHEGEYDEETGNREAQDSQISVEKECTREETPEKAEKTTDNTEGERDEDIEGDTKTGKEGVGTKYNKEKGESTQADGGEITERSQDQVDAEGHDCTMDSPNQDLEESTHLEDQGTTNASAGEDDEDVEEEEKDHIRGSQEEGASLQQERASPKTGTASPIEVQNDLPQGLLCEYNRAVCEHDQGVQVYLKRNVTQHSLNANSKTAGEANLTIQLDRLNKSALFHSNYSPPDESSTGDVCVTKDEEADAEDSETDAKYPSDTGAGDSVNKKETEEVEGGATADGAVLHQITRTSVESLLGSLED